MHITSIKCRGWKGLNCDTTIHKLNLILGPNGTGKSALLAAPMYAIEGHVGLGERPEATAQIVGVAGAHVDLTLDDGFSWRRCLVRDHHKHTLSTSVIIAGQGDVGVRAGDPIIHDHVGDFAPMFDLGVFLRLSDDKRRDFVLDLCGHAHGNRTVDRNVLRARLAIYVASEYLGSATVAEASAGMFGESVHNLSPNQKAGLVGRLLTELQGPVREQLPRALDSIMAELPATDVEAISGLLKNARELTNSSRRSKDEARAAARKLSETKAGLTVVAGTVSDMRERLTGLQTQAAEVRQQIAFQEGHARAIQALSALLDSVRAEEGQKIADVANMESYNHLAALQEAESLAAKAKQLREENPEPVREDYTSEAFAARQLRMEHDENLATVSRELAHTEDNLARYNRALQELEDSPWTKLLDKIGYFSVVLEELVGCGTWPQRVADAWMEIENFVRAHAGLQEKPEILRKRDTAQQQLEALQANRDSRIATTAEALHKEQQAHKQMVEAHEAHDKALIRHAKASEDAELLEIKARDIRLACSRREEMLALYQAEVEKLTEKRLDAERRLEAERSSVEEVPIEQLQQQEAGLASAVAKLTEEYEAKRKYAALEETLTAAIAKAERQAVLWEVAKHLANGVRELRENLMHELVAPLLAHMDEFLAVAAPKKHSYCLLQNEAGSKVTFVLGWIDSDRRRPFPALSGGEAIIFSAALAYALIRLADPPLKLLLLEVSELDDVNMVRLLAALEAVSLNLSNVMVATHRQGDREPCLPQWRVIYPKRTVDQLREEVAEEVPA